MESIKCPSCSKVEGVVFMGMKNDKGSFSDLYECVLCDEEWALAPNEQEVTNLAL
jgi:hypothetical protein